MKHTETKFRILFSRIKLRSISLKAELIVKNSDLISDQNTSESEQIIVIFSRRKK